MSWLENASVFCHTPDNNARFVSAIFISEIHVIRKQTLRPKQNFKNISVVIKCCNFILKNNFIIL